MTPNIKLLVALVAGAYVATWFTKKAWIGGVASEADAAEGSRKAARAMARNPLWSLVP